MKKHMRVVVALCAALSLVAGSSALLAQGAAKPKEVKRSKAEQVDIDTLLTVVDNVKSGKLPAPTDIGITWDSNNFFRAPDGTTYMPFTITLDKSKLASPTAAIYLRASDKAAPAPAANAKGKDKAAQGWEKIDFAMVGADGRVSRYIQVKPGDYDLYVAVKDKGTAEKIDKNYMPKVGVLKKEVMVPDFNKAELTTSSMLLATAIQPAPAGASPDEDPYIFGQMQFVPSHDGKYKKADMLDVIYWVYGATGDASGKPDLTIENSFSTKNADGTEKFFNKTQPQALNSQTPYNVMQGIPNFLEVPLLSFPAGDYHLQIKITDKPSGKMITQDVNFSVAAS